MVTGTCPVLLSALVAAFLAMTAGAFAAPIVTEARIGQHDAVTRFVLLISERVPYQVFTLSDPHRVVIDLPEVRWGVTGTPLPTPQGVLTRLRHGPFKPGTMRVVLECAGPAQVKNSSLAEAPGGRGHQLTIDVLASAPFGHGVPARKPEILAPQPGNLSPPIGALRDSGSPVIALANIGVPPARPSRLHTHKRVIVLDAGHGGDDPGATSLSGAYEKRITLAAAREVRDRLQALGRYQVVMTRDSDRFIRLRDRVAMARAAEADLFVSIHADAHDNRATRGLSVYTLSERASDAEAAALAERENKSDLIAGVNLTGEPPEVATILIDLVQRETKNESARLASHLVRSLADDTLLLPNTHRYAGFAVLKAPDIPSVLIELGYLSNPEDERALVDAGRRRKLTAAIARAIHSYFTEVQEPVQEARR
jgi:N-acetylmuramoyl-L-alanine amidase